MSKQQKITTSRTRTYRSFFCTDDGHEGTLDMFRNVYEDGSSAYVDITIGTKPANRCPVVLIDASKEREGMFHIHQREYGKDHIGKLLKKNCFFCDVKYTRHYIPRDEAKEIVEKAITKHNWRKPMSQLMTI